MLTLSCHSDELSKVFNIEELLSQPDDNSGHAYEAGHKHDKTEEAKEIDQDLSYDPDMKIEEESDGIESQSEFEM